MKKNVLLSHENAERILQEGWIMFQQKGYRGVTLDELCLRCKITKPTLYYYFEDKETLFVQVLKFKLQGFREVIEKPGGLAERLAATAEVILESFITDYNALLRDREHIKRPEYQQLIRDAFHNELFGPLNRLMKNGMAQGELRAGQPEMLTLVYLGMVNNFIGRQRDNGQDSHQRALWLADCFLKGAERS